MTLLLNVARSTKWSAMMKLIATSLGLALFASGAQAQSLKEKFELSERCGKLSAERFEKDWGDGLFSSPDKQLRIRANYENHYSSRLNKCFYIDFLDMTYRGEVIKTIRLFDLNENRQIAYYSEGPKRLAHPLTDLRETGILSNSFPS